MDGGAWWAAVHGVTRSRTQLSDFTFTFHFHALEKEMPTHSSVLAWRIPRMGEPCGLPSMGSHRVGHDWSDLAAAAAAAARGTEHTRTSLLSGASVLYTQILEMLHRTNESKFRLRSHQSFQFPVWTWTDWNPPAFGRVGNLTSLTGFLCQVPSEDPIQLLKEQMPRSPPLPHWQPLSEEADPPTKAG